VASAALVGQVQGITVAKFFFSASKSLIRALAVGNGYNGGNGGSAQLFGRGGDGGKGIDATYNNGTRVKDATAGGIGTPEQRSTQ